MADTERILVEKFKEAKDKLDSIKERLKQAQLEYSLAESSLVELLTAQGKEATARYEGLGFVGLTKPELYASCLKENEDALFAFLESKGRTDLVRQTVHSRSLSSYIKEILAEGESVPEFISYYLKPGVRFYSR